MLEVEVIRTFLLWLLSFFPQRTIMRNGEKYLTRYYLLGGPRTGARSTIRLPFNLFVHCFHASDDPPAHNHPWTWARSLILAGEYREMRLLELDRAQLSTAWISRRFGPGAVNRIDADTYHYVTLLTPEVWTLFLVGKNVQDWEFLA